MKKILGICLFSLLAAFLLAPGVLAGAAEATDEIAVKGIARPVEKVVLSANMTGQITEILVDEGDRIRKGQLLLKMNDRSLTLEAQLYRLQAGDDSSLRLWQVQAALAEEELGRYEALAKDKVTAPAEYARARAQAELAKIHVEQEKMRLEQAKIAYQMRLAALQNARVISPLDGVVVDRLHEEGESVEVLTNLFTVVRMDEIIIEVNLPEEAISWLKQQEEVNVRFPVFKEKDFKGKVDSISPVVDSRSGTVPVKVKVPNPDFLIKPGLQAVVTFRR